MFTPQQGTGFQSGDQMRPRITKLLIQDTGTYNVQFRRPYMSEGSLNLINEFANRLEGQTSIAASQVAGVAGQFVHPQATPEKEIVIANGWGQRRMRFMMEVQHGSHVSGHTTEVILGYTEHNEGVIVHSGAVDPRMRFFINSIIQVRNTAVMTPTGMGMSQTVTDNSHVLYNDTPGGLAGMFAAASQKEMRLRPYDVFMTIGRAHLPESEQIYDTRVIQGPKAELSKRQNNMPANYVADVLQSYKAASMHGRQFGQAEEQVITAAAGYVRERAAEQNPFLSALSQMHGTPVANWFTFADLLAIDPAVDAVTQVVLMGPTQQNMAHVANQTATWGTADHDTVIATSLSNSVPALMMELALTKIAFKSTNNNVGGQPLTMILDAGSFSNIDQSQSLAFFTHQLEKVLLADLTMNNQISYALEMRVDLLGETWIHMSFDARPFIDYVTPSFCDALLTPVLTTNAQQAVSLAHDFDQLTGYIGDRHSNFGNQWASGGGMGGSSPQPY